MAAIKMGIKKFAAPVQSIGAALALLASCQPAFAQSFGPSADRSSPDAAMKSLHDALHLTPQQGPAWLAYSDQMALAAQTRARQQAGARMLPGLDAPRRMDLIEAEMRQELADLHMRSQALKSFYAVLTPSQRRTFDQRTLPPQNR